MSDHDNQYTPRERNGESGTSGGRHFQVKLTEEQLNAVPQTEADGSIPETAQRVSAGARNARNEQALRKEAKAHRKRNKVKARKNKRIFTLTWLAMILLVSLMVSSYLIGGSNDFFAVDRMESTVTVTIPEDVTADELADILYQSHAIEKPEFFALYCKIKEDMEYFTAGSYDIETNLDYEALINELQAGPDLGEEIEGITFPEGITIERFAEILEENGLHTKDEVLEACNSIDFSDYDFIADISNADEKYYLLEGYLFPDTYNFFENESVETTLRRFLDNFESRVEDLQADIAASDYTLDEIITLASIIQAEAANTDDMYMISAILHNRLENGESHDIYSLDCDSTLYYPYNSSTAPEGYVSRYSTYLNNGGVSGLPAGAICNPGLDAIDAALHPSAEGSDYYYFCHDADGNPYYAATADEHQANLAAAGLL